MKFKIVTQSSVTITFHCFPQIQEDKEDAVPNTIRYIGQVMIEVKGHGVHSEGVGLGEFNFNPGGKLSCGHYELAGITS